LLDSVHAPRCVARAWVRPGATAAGQPPAEGGGLPALQAPTTPCRGRTRRPSTCPSNSSTPSRRVALPPATRPTMRRALHRAPASHARRPAASRHRRHQAGRRPARAARCCAWRRLHAGPAPACAAGDAARAAPRRAAADRAPVLVMIRKEDYLLVFLWCVVTVQVLDHQPDARGRLGGAVRGGGPPGGAADAGRGGRRRGARELRHPRVHAGAPRRRGATCGHTCILGWSGVLPTPCAAPRAPSAPQAPYLPLLCSSCRGAVVRLHMLPSGAPAGQHALASPTLSYMPSFIACCLHHRHGCARLPPSTPHPPFAPMVRS
jgi:hypothetical protein